jgi:hypothetical protein
LAVLAEEGGLEVRREELEPLNADQRLDRLAVLGIAAGLLPEDAREEARAYVRRMLTVFNSNSQAAFDYRPRSCGGE